MEPEQIQDINARIAACTRCPLSATRTQTVPGHGDPHAELLFIGEAPGFYEDQQGVPFVGRSGALLDQLLEGINLTRSDVFVANIIKCRPPDNRDPIPTEIATCQPYITEQIGGINPKLIVTLGRFAMQYFLPGAAMGRSHGQPIHAGPHTIYPLYHPAAALRQGRLHQVLRDDFARIPELLRTTQRPDPNDLTPPIPHDTTPTDQANQLKLL